MFQNINFFKSQDSLNNSLKEGKYLLLVAQNSKFEFKDLPKDVAIVGGIFPRIVFHEQTYEEGFLLAKMSPCTSALIIEHMDGELEIPDLEKLNSFMIVVDGLSSKIDYFLESFFELVGENAMIIGGGAGKLTLKQEPVIFSNYDMYQDAALIIGSYDLMGVGLKHGWSELEGPFIVTDSKNCELKQINYMDAFKFYKNIIEKHSKTLINKDNFFDIAKGYPFGINRYSKEAIVRDPITTNGNSIILVGNIDINAVISVLKGSKSDLIDASRKAALCAIKNLPNKKPKQALLVDCISRLLYLDTSFEDELRSIANEFDKNTILWGVLSLGEIANVNREKIEFYNKTCVIGAL